MAILTMKRIELCGLRSERKNILERLQRLGNVEIRKSDAEDSVFSRQDTAEACSKFDAELRAGTAALDALQKYAPQKSSPLAMLEGRKELSPDVLAAFTEKKEEHLSLIQRINSLAKEIGECKAEIPKLSTQIESLTPWLGLDVALNFSGTRTTRAFIGTFAGDIPPEELLTSFDLPAETPLDLSIISHSPQQTCVFILCMREDAVAVESALRGAGFALPPISVSTVPTAQKAAWEKAIEECEAIIARNIETLETLSEKRGDIRLFIDYCTMRREKYEAIGRLLNSRHTFYLTGYVPERDAEALQAELENSFSVCVTLHDPAEDEDVPVAVVNNKFVAPMEGVMKGFSLPGKGEMDPSTMMAVFYYVLFGMMLSDAGYGALMAVGCGFALLKFKNMDEGWSKTLRMYFYCGISTVFWGAMYGSWFGDAPAVIARTFFNSDFAVRPIWVDPLTQPMQMLMFCLLVGVIHLFAGLGCRIYQHAKNKNPAGIWLDTVPWYFLITGLLLFALSAQGFIDIVQLSFILPPLAGAIGKWMAIAGAVVIVAFGGRHSKNPLLRFALGLYELYNVSGWLGDILSYSRLLALGLATGVIGQVVNQMGSMGGRSVFGVIMFIAVFLIGHPLNIAINLLGAYVHTNRLQFVEFFGKFYEGGGREFEPLANHTKYYKMKSTEVKKS